MTDLKAEIRNVLKEILLGETGVSCLGDSIQEIQQDIPVLIVKRSDIEREACLFMGGQKTDTPLRNSHGQIVNTISFHLKGLKALQRPANYANELASRLTMSCEGLDGTAFILTCNAESSIGLNLMSFLGEASIDTNTKITIKFIGAPDQDQQASRTVWLGNLYINDTWFKKSTIDPQLSWIDYAKSLGSTLPKEIVDYTPREHEVIYSLPNQSEQVSVVTDADLPF